MLSLSRVRFQYLVGELRSYKAGGWPKKKKKKEKKKNIIWSLLNLKMRMVLGALKDTPPIFFMIYVFVNLFLLK